jgi:hypothetical protein
MDGLLSLIAINLALLRALEPGFGAFMGCPAKILYQRHQSIRGILFIGPGKEMC